MSDTTKIQWADATFNPWIGCTKVSPGCANCYAENTTRARVLRAQGLETWGKGRPRSRTSEANWKQPIKWNKEQADMDLQWRKGNFNPQERPRIFPSLCDWLDDEVPIEWLADFLKLIHDTPNLDWLLLTKRPENFEARIRLAELELVNGPHERDDPRVKVSQWLSEWRHGEKTPANVWFGVSVEDQKRADERIPKLTEIPALIRFLSVEPLLGLIDLEYPESLWPAGPPMCCNGQECGCRGMPIDPPLSYGIDWVIVGGESGSHARPCQAEWIRSVAVRCKSAAIPVFVKQLGAHPIMGREDAQIVRDKKGGDPSEWPEDLRVRQFPK